MPPKTTVAHHYDAKVSNHPPSASKPRPLPLLYVAGAWEKQVARLETFVKDSQLVSPKEQKRLTKKIYSDFEKRAFAIRNQLNKLRTTTQLQAATYSKIQAKINNFEEWLVRMEHDVDDELSVSRRRGPVVRAVE